MQRRQANHFFFSSFFFSIFELGGLKKHLMTGPSGNSKFCFPSTSMFPSASPRGTLRVWGNKTHCFPCRQSLSAENSLSLRWIIVLVEFQSWRTKKTTVNTFYFRSNIFTSALRGSCAQAYMINHLTSNKLNLSFGSPHSTIVEFTKRQSP